MPTSGGLAKAVRSGAAIGCTAIQVFTSNPRQWKGRPPTEEERSALSAALAESGMAGFIISHDTYLVNLCAPDEDKRLESRQCLKEELTRCSLLGIPYVVSHIGAAMGQAEDDAHQEAARGILEVLAETPEDVMLLMETTAGQGSSLHWRFDQLARTLDLAGGPPRLGVCLDTCHIFAAGCDIRSGDGWLCTMDEFDRLIGLDRLKAIHCNDSKAPLGSRKDRHEHIGKGEIGPDGFRAMLNDHRLLAVPIVLETPEAETQHKANLDLLWSMAA